MTIQDLKDGIAELDAAIADTEAQMQTNLPPDVSRALSARLIGLQGDRSGLQAQLDNLQAAAVEVTGQGGD